MDSVLQYFKAIDPDILSLLKLGAIFFLVILIFSLFGRMIFGKKSALNTAVCSAIGILFIYLLTAIFHSLGARFDALVAPLPFVSISGTTMVLFSFQADYTVVCAEIASMIVLCFLINLSNGWLPKGKQFLGWLFFRCLGVVIAYMMHLLLVWLFNTYLPEGIVTYAPTILLTVLVLMILTGALKFLIGAVISATNPLLGAMYTFFFANVVGKQITRAVLTTALLAGLVWLMNYLGCGVISIASGAMVLYVPYIIVLVAAWYIISNKF